MSYCRFSSNNMMCDVYVYADCGGGWTTHIAGNRLMIPPIPEPPFSIVVVRGAVFDKESRKMVYDRKVDKLIAVITARLYGWMCKPHKWSLRLIPHRYIGLPHDGGSFNHETPSECADNLERLRGFGQGVGWQEVLFRQVYQCREDQEADHRTTAGRHRDHHGDWLLGLDEGD